MWITRKIKIEIIFSVWESEKWKHLVNLYAIGRMNETISFRIIISRIRRSWISFFFLKKISFRFVFIYIGCKRRSTLHKDIKSHKYQSSNEVIICSMFKMFDLIPLLKIINFVLFADNYCEFIEFNQHSFPYNI